MSHRLQTSGWSAAVASALLAGCGGEYSDAAPPPANPTAPTGRNVLYHGYFAGLANIDGVDRFADAILTADGVVRLHVGGPQAISGTLQEGRPAQSMQFMGNVQTTTLPTHFTVSGSGVVVSQTCTPPDIDRFCSGTASGELSVTIDAGSLSGELRVTTGQATETWTLTLTEWPLHYSHEANLSEVRGQYVERLAEFASAADTVLNVDAAGRMFFQSPDSQCVGNGSVSPHADGRFGVFDVVLQVESCVAEWQYLNGEYRGLLVLTPSDYWNYDAVLRMWLSKPAAPRTAVSSMGEYIY